MSLDDNFDLVLAIPCDTLKTKKKKSIDSIASTSLAKLSDSPVKYGDTEFKIKNVLYDNKANIAAYSKIFCEQIKEHGNYELIFNDENSTIKTVRKSLLFGQNNRARQRGSGIETIKTPLLFGQVILYEDEKNDKFNPLCCYNFFCVLGELTIEDDVFSIIYFVVPDINYQDSTLLMDQSHELWCNIDGQCVSSMNNENHHIIFTDYVSGLGYKYFGKIYSIVFSDLKQYKKITNGKSSKKIFNILAGEVYKNDDKFSHQITLSENTNEYILSKNGKKEDIVLSKKEKFFDDYNMYSSYGAYASIYAYYYVIKEGNRKKDIFHDRIAPDETDEGFSSEANILFVLETEILKITACLVLSKRINEQIKSPDMKEIQKMFGSFINTRPLFEKLNYRYLGAQKEADFIYNQFRIGDIVADYDRKRELLRNYSEVTNSITANKNSKIIQAIGMLFTFTSGFSVLSRISHILFDNEKTMVWTIDFILPAIVLVILVVIFVGMFISKKGIKKIFSARAVNINKLGGGKDRKADA